MRALNKLHRAVIALPPDVTTPAETMRLCLGGQSRQTLHNWTKRGFPRPFRNSGDRMWIYNVDACARFLTDHGFTVERIG